MESIDVCRVPDLKGTRQSLALGKAVVNGSFTGALTLFYRVLFGTRQMIRRVPEKLHSAKPSLPSLCSPSALCQVRHSANLISSAIGPLSSILDTWQTARVR